MPKAYILAELTIADPAAYAASGYMEMAQASVAAQGGRFIVRGGSPELLEGEPAPGRVVILEFPDIDAARRFYHGANYAPAIKLRQSLAWGRLVLLEGAASAPD